MEKREITDINSFLIIMLCFIIIMLLLLLLIIHELWCITRMRWYKLYFDEDARVFYEYI